MKKSYLFILLTIVVFSAPTYIFYLDALLDNTISGNFEVRDHLATPTGDVANVLTIECPLGGEPDCWPKSATCEIYDPNDQLIFTTTYSFNDCITTITDGLTLEFESSGSYTVKFIDNDKTDGIGWDVTSSIEF